MITACIVTFNDMPLIRDCVESIYDKVDKIIVIDGRYKDFPGSSDISTDGTIQYLSGMDKVEVMVVTDLNEIEKRNVYLGFLDDGDICLNIDADEVLITGLSKLKSDIGIIQIGEKGDRQRHRRSNRFFRFREGLHYWGTHKMILDKDGKLFANLDRVGTDYTSEKTKVEFLHNNHRRDYNRQQDKKKYYQILMKREAKINEPIT